jgi:hypothetical protein
MAFCRLSIVCLDLLVIELRRDCINFRSIVLIEDEEKTGSIDRIKMQSKYIHKAKSKRWKQEE